MNSFTPRLIRLKVKRNKEKQVFNWLNELKVREEENLRSMTAEGIRAEAVFSSSEGERLFVTFVLLQERTGAPTISDTWFDRKNHEVLMECMELENVETYQLEYGLKNFRYKNIRN